jgi:hypothetical protein
MDFEKLTSKAEECGDIKCLYCLEGCLLGKKVYCNMDGCFYPPDSGLDCRHFIAKRRATHTN